MERQRRATAGKRLTFLTGQAAENDDAFWGHETWKEDSDEGNESFHSSDEDSELQRDEFDSDFDESESDHEAEEEEAGAAEEQELLESERKKKKRKGTYMEISSAGRNLLVKQQPMAKRTKYTKGKRAIGDGLNAGIVLNLPPPPSAVATAAGVAGAVGVAGPSVIAGVALKPAPVAANQQQLPLTAVSSTGVGTAGKGTVGPAPAVAPKHSPTRAKSTGATTTLAATRKRRNATSAYGPRERAVKQTVDTFKPKASPTVSAAATKKKQPKETHSQEDLIVEAVQETEPENLRWLLGRKRYQAEKDKEATPRETRGSGHTVIEKFVSRRGYPNTITFPNMDHVPALLVPKKAEAGAKQKRPPKKCVITGRAARYRDPKTGMGYHDAAAFKELRRRHASKEPLDQRKKKAPPKNAAAACASSAAAAAVTGGGSTTEKAPASSPAAAAAANGGAVSNPASNLSNASSKPAPVAKTGNGDAAANGGNITDAPDLATAKAAASAGPTVAMPHRDAPVSSASPANPKPVLPPGDTSTHAKEAPSPSAAAASSTATVADVNSAPGRRSPRRRKPSAKVLEGGNSVGGQPILPSLTASAAPDATFAATTTTTTTTTNSVEEESAALTTMSPPKPDEEQKV